MTAARAKRQVDRAVTLTMPRLGYAGIYKSSCNNRSSTSGHQCTLVGHLTLFVCLQIRLNTLPDLLFLHLGNRLPLAVDESNSKLEPHPTFTLFGDSGSG